MVMSRSGSGLLPYCILQAMLERSGRRQTAGKLNRSQQLTKANTLPIAWRNNGRNASEAEISGRRTVALTLS